MRFSILHGWVSPSSARELPLPPDIPQLGKVDHTLGIVLDEGHQAEDVVRRKVPGLQNPWLSNGSAAAQ